MRRLLDKDFLTGVLFLGFGCGAAAMAASYRLGTSSKMGPGYFPMILGGVLAALGLYLIVRSAAASVDKVEFGDMKALAIVLASIAVFAVAAPKLGFVAAAMLLVVLSRLASPARGWREILLSAAALTAFASLIFIYGLGVSLPLGPTIF